MSTYFIQQEEKYDTAPGAPAATQNQLMALLNQVSEHFGCFSIYAYDFNGNPLKLGAQASQMEESALRSLIKADILGELTLISRPMIVDEEDFDEFEGEWEEGDEDQFGRPSTEEY